VPWLVAALTTIAFALAIGNAWLRNTPPAPVQRFAITVPASDPLIPLPTTPDVAISPDGTRLAYLAKHADSTRLLLRSLDQTEFKPLAGTDGAQCPAFSPDGSWLAFQAAGKLKRVPVNGGAVVAICDCARINGGIFWADDDSILFVPSFQSGIWKVAATGGVAQPIAKPDSSRHEIGYVWPQLLPKHAGLLFTIGLDSIASMDDGVLAVRTERNETRIVLTGGRRAAVLPTGHLIYGHSNSLLAAAFDMPRLKLTGNPVPVVEGVAMRRANGSARFAFSNTGTLVYVPSSAVDRLLSIVSVSRNGTVEPLAAYPDFSDHIDGLTLSPDGRQLAFKVASANDDIQILNLERRITSRFTFEAGDKINPVWTPDGTRIAYSNLRGDGATLVWRPIDSRGEPQPILPGGNADNASSISPDGKTLVFTRADPKTGDDLWTIELDGTRQPKPFLQTPFNESAAIFSPDGHWLAYTSNKSGTSQVYAVRFPDGRGEIQISTDGGIEPSWAASGRELFYRNGDQMVVAAVATQPVFTLGKPQVLFTAPFVRGSGQGNPLYAATRDGQHFLMVKEKEAEPVRQLNVVVNWFEELKRRVPVGGK
jgi:eukaryotic-like serine/threonine-protein kinase